MVRIAQSLNQTTEKLHGHEVTRYNYSKYPGVKYLRTEGIIGPNLVLVKDGRITGIHIYFEDGYEEKGQELIDDILNIVQDNPHGLF